MLLVVPVVIVLLLLRVVDGEVSRLDVCELWRRVHLGVVVVMLLVAVVVVAVLWL